MRHTLIRNVNWLLTLPALASTVVGAQRALKGSVDFQWSGAHLLLKHIDPFREAINGNRNNLLILSQGPVYLHELYVLLLPLGCLPAHTADALWLALNIALLLVVVLRLAHLNSLSRNNTVLLLLLIMCGGPFRATVGNGQTSLLIMTCIIYALPERSVGASLALGVSYSKYSFSPLLVFYLLCKRRFRFLLMSLAMPILGLFVVWSLVKGTFLTILAEPFTAIRFCSSGTAGIAKLMAVSDHLSHLAYSNTPVYGYIASVIASSLYSIYLSRKQNIGPAQLLSCISVGSLMFFRHLSYDFIFLAIPLAYALTAWRRRNLFIIAIVCAFWYFPFSAVNNRWRLDSYSLYAGFLLISTLLCLLSDCCRWPGLTALATHSHLIGGDAGAQAR